MKIIAILIVVNLCVVRYDALMIQGIDERPNLVLLGDSITAINENQTFGIDGCGSYSDLLTKWWNCKNMEVINEGIGGSYMKDVNVNERITRHHPKYVIIEYGINDVFMCRNPNDFYNYYNEKIDEIKEQNPNATIFLSTIIWANTSKYGWDSYYSEYLQVGFKNAIIQIATERNITWVNLWDKFYRNNSLLCDGVHPNEQGARIIAETMNDTFYNLINPSSFNYTCEIQVERRYDVNFNFNFKFNLNFNLNFNLKEYETKHVDSINPTIIVLMFSYMNAVSLFLLNERKKRIRILQMEIIQGGNKVG